MRTIMIFVATVATLTMPSPASAPAAAQRSTPQPQFVSLSHPCSESRFRTYARAVYRRRVVSSKAHHRLRRLRSCLSSWALRYQHRLAQARYERMHAWAYATASWYSSADSGGTPACGFGWLANGVANKTLPCGARVRMCASTCATATVADRGPFVAGRDFDLMPGLRDALGCGGICRVRWRMGTR